MRLSAVSVFGLPAQPVVLPLAKVLRRKPRNQCYTWMKDVEHLPPLKSDEERIDER
jgi:hypothetical protein